MNQGVEANSPCPSPAASAGRKTKLLFERRCGNKKQEEASIIMDDELKRMIEEAAGVLKNAGAREVYIFGSVVNGSFNEKSDIDIAVTELPPENYFKAMGDAVDVIGRPVDLIDLDEVNPFTRYLKEEGELLRVGLTSNKEAGLMVNNKL